MLMALEVEAGSPSTATRSLALARASSVLREHKDRNAAVQLLHASALQQPANISLWRNLEDLAMASSRYEIATQACLRQLQTLDKQDDASRAELHYRTGRLLMMRMDRVPEGLASMRKALRLSPSHVIALEDTARYLIANGLWSQLLELFKLRISTSEEAGLGTAETARAHVNAAQILEEQLEDLEGARALYERATTIDPAYRPARDRLERVLHQLGRHDALVQFYQEELKRSEGEERSAFLLSILAQLHSQKKAWPQAIDSLDTLIKDRPQQASSLQRLARLLAKSDRKKDLLRITEQEIALSTSPLRQAKLHHRAGELALLEGEEATARTHFEASLEAVDDYSPSLDRLEELLRKDRDHEGLHRLIQRRLLYCHDRPRQLALHIESARLCANRLGRPEDALGELLHLLERQAHHLPALHLAEHLAHRLERWETLLEILERHINTVRGRRTRALLLHRRARVRFQKLEDEEGAIRDLVRALELWPQLGVARALLLRLYEGLEKTRELQAFAEAGLAAERGADDRRALALQLAELTPKPVVAVQYLATVAEARPEDFVTQSRLARAASSARRHTRSAQAFLGLADGLSDELPPDDPSLLAIRYRAARAKERSGNLEEADEIYAKILDAMPGHTLARHARLRLKQRRRSKGDLSRFDRFDRAKEGAGDRVQRAAFATIAAELHERRGNLERAQDRLEAALQESPDYLPALHYRARIAQRLGGEGDLPKAIRCLEHAAKLLNSVPHRVRALSRAGILSLRAKEEKQANPDAWRFFAEALFLDPGEDTAFRGLERTLSRHGEEGASSLLEALEQRLDRLQSRSELDSLQLQRIGRLAFRSDGPEAAVKLLEAGIETIGEEADAHADLAHYYARIERWPEVVRELELALRYESSPERKAAFHYFAGVALERANALENAIPHYLQAGQGAFYPRHALLAADRIATKLGSVELRVQALQSLVEHGDGQERARCLRALAELHRGPLGQAEVAIEHMRELLLLSPYDIDVLQELQRLFLKLGRSEEATAALLASLAYHRAWLRSQDIEEAEPPSPLHQPVVGMRRIFELLGDADGIYLSSAVLESHGESFEGESCDGLVSDPWPLPQVTEGRPFDLLIGDLPASTAIDLLHEGSYLLRPFPHPPSLPDLSQRHPLPDGSSVVLVCHSLAKAFGFAPPSVYADPDASPDSVLACLTEEPILLVGRKIQNTPFSPESRDRLGRALVRLALGGDVLLSEEMPSAIPTVLQGLCRSVGTIPPFLDSEEMQSKTDATLRIAVERTVERSPSLESLDRAVQEFASKHRELDLQRLRDSLAMAEDRAGIIAAADPRPTLNLLGGDDQKKTRLRSLLEYLLSDNHLELRRNLGYQVALELDEHEFEELPT